MKNILRGTWTSVLMTLAAMVSANVTANGGLVDLDFGANPGSNEISNPWWPLSQGDRFTYFGEDGCELAVMDVVINGLQTRDFVNGVAVREILDRAYVDETGECDADVTNPDDPDWTLVETTFDWYAQDVAGNVWYFGEETIAFDHETCEHWVTDELHPEDGCTDGSWEAGKDVADIGVTAEEGIVMLSSPEKGQFYLQEFYAGEAEDMGKILNFKPVDNFFHGELENCVTIKEWVPLSPGSIEHKHYCYGVGLVLVEELTGGPTATEELVLFHAGPE